MVGEESYSEIPLDQLWEDILDWALVGVKLHLSRTVKQEVTVTVLCQLALQPVQIGFHILHAVKKSTIRPQLQVLHNIIQSDQLPDVHGAWIRDALVGWVHVHHHHLASQAGQELLHPLAVSGFTGARWADDHLTEAQRGFGSWLSGHGVKVFRWTGTSQSLGAGVTASGCVFTRVTVYSFW